MDKQIEDRVYTMLARAKNRAKEKGLPFNLVDVYIPNYCPVLGIELRWTNTVINDNSPSLDRIVPEKGYVEGNVHVISQRANIIKQNATSEEILKVAKWLERLEE